MGTSWFVKVSLGRRQTRSTRWRPGGTTSGAQAPTEAKRRGAVAAHPLKRPILLVCGTTASVQMRLDTLASEGFPHGRHYTIERRDGGVYYRPDIRGPWIHIPDDTLILAPHVWHYTAAVCRTDAAEQAGRLAASLATTPDAAVQPS